MELPESISLENTTPEQRDQIVAILATYGKSMLSDTTVTFSSIKQSRKSITAWSGTMSDSSAISAADFITKYSKPPINFYF